MNLKMILAILLITSTGLALANEFNSVYQYGNNTNHYGQHLKNKRDYYKQYGNNTNHYGQHLKNKRDYYKSISGEAAYSEWVNRTNTQNFGSTTLTENCSGRNSLYGPIYNNDTGNSDAYICNSNLIQLREELSKAVESEKKCQENLISKLQCTHNLDKSVTCGEKTYFLKIANDDSILETGKEITPKAVERTVDKPGSIQE